MAMTVDGKEKEEIERFSPDTVLSPGYDGVMIRLTREEQTVLLFFFLIETEDVVPHWLTLDQPPDGWYLPLNGITVSGVIAGWEVGRLAAFKN